MRKKTLRQRWLSSRNNQLLATGLVLLAIGLIGVGYYHHSHKSAPSTVGTASDGSKINLSPPTSSDKSSNDAHKSELIQKDQHQSDNSTPSGSANVVITEVSSSAVKAYISGVFEDVGTCSATATQGGQTITASSTGFKNVSYTQCAPMSWSSPLGSGTWSITVSYKSITTQGSQTISKTL